MSYTHFGKQADVWKHLALSEIIYIEQPDIYIETNSAYADYILDDTPERQYGIYTFMDKAKSDSVLSESVYYQIESKAFAYNKYIGSPGLALNILKDKAEKFIFFDLEKEALNNIADYAESLDISGDIQTLNRDSITGGLEIIPDLASQKTVLFHIDPYEIDKPNKDGYNYLDLFIEAASSGFKCFLWYGFNTLDEKIITNDFILSGINNTKNISCIELIMEIIEKDTVPCNPGILGSGILTANLSENSISVLSEYATLLVNAYKNVNYRNFRGSLYLTEVC